MLRTIGVGCDGNPDGAPGAAEDGDRVRRPVGTELPERGPMSLMPAVGNQQRELPRQDMIGVVIAVDVAGDEMEQVVFADERQAKPQARGMVAVEAELVIDAVLDRAQRESDAQPGSLRDNEPVATGQRQRRPVTVAPGEHGQLQHKAMQLETHRLQSCSHGRTSGSTLFRKSVQSIFLVGSSPLRNFSMLV